MDAVRRVVEAITPKGLALLLLAPLAAGLTAVALAPMVLSAKYAASARIDTYPVTGTHASYEVASAISDFGAQYMGAADAVASATGRPVAEVGSFLTATRTEDSGLAQVGFQAPTEVDAEGGLRVAATHALTSVADSNLTRARILMEGAQREAKDAAEDARRPLTGGEEAYLRRARQSRIDASLNALNEARAQVTAAAVARERVSGLVASAPVDVEKVSTTSDTARFAVAAAATALLVALGAVLFFRRRHLTILVRGDAVDVMDPGARRRDERS